MEVEPGVTLEVLNPPEVTFERSGSDRNNNAVVLHLVYGEVSFLLTSDIESFTKDYLARNSTDLGSVVLKAAHQGSRSSTITAFLNQVSPEVAVISSGSGNQFGHPQPEVANRFEETLGFERVFRTDRQGTVELATDGINLWASPKGITRSLRRILNVVQSCILVGGLR